MKKFISVLLAVVMMLSVALTAVGAVEADNTSVGAYTITSGDYKFTLLEDGTAKITECTSTETDVVIPSTLNGFEVSVIGHYALPWKVVNLTISDTVTTIEEYAFYHCDNLETVTIPKSVTSMEYNFDAALYACNFKEYIVDSENPVYSSEDGVLFNKSKTILLDYPEYKEAESYTVPSTVTAIKDMIAVSLHNLTITENVSKIETEALAENQYLHDITVVDDNKYYSSEDGVLFNKDKTRLIKFPGNKDIQSYTVPDSVYRIWDYAFYWCDLNYLTLNDGLAYINAHAFEQTCIFKLVIPDSVVSLGEYAFYKLPFDTEIILSENITTIEPYTFYDCEEIPTVVIPEKVTSIGEFAFYGCESITEVDLPDGLETIGGSAFCECVSLTEVNIPDSVTSIDIGVFCNCICLKKVTIPSSVTAIGDNAFLNCNFLTIYGYLNTAAHTYATDNSVEFVALNIKGDVNLDSVVNIIDATEIQKAVSGVTSFSNGVTEIADVNGDGVLNVSDATMIQKYCVGLEEITT